ncbi:hypothetical protein P175DRAFT_0532686 [Aspergillus ochraceoroseus IBT 24754]|uniref:Uncharacterized protein n=1 Tax=Aspergillus ochraceoroseus IBT 24754 TaxID=1392256 RepID=A0A2T5LTY2_9EURO|nr:uncharacterized protein P175DRAFT_0532686 [Aspergillus ochraceoroseus IBT 24754]PTU19742.1 hypothetical protein P175DRAFT_0532686 [Aspergillus ochraceoroseus IBT 24754]
MPFGPASADSSGSYDASKPPVSTAGVCARDHSVTNVKLTACPRPWCRISSTVCNSDFGDLSPKVCQNINYKGGHPGLAYNILTASTGKPGPIHEDQCGIKFCNPNSVYHQVMVKHSRKDIEIGRDTGHALKIGTFIQIVESRGATNPLLNAPSNALDVPLPDISNSSSPLGEQRSVLDMHMSTNSSALNITQRFRKMKAICKGFFVTM